MRAYSERKEKAQALYLQQQRLAEQERERLKEQATVDLLAIERKQAVA